MLARKLLNAKKIVVIGGGTGVFTVLSGLRKHFYNLSAVVSMADEGGSTGVLREDFGVLPPGDIRRALVALSRTENKALSDLFSYRFAEGGGLKGHSFGNLMLTALERITGSFEKAVEEASRILSVEGEVIPVTLAPTHLCAQLQDGTIVYGENNIDIPKHDGKLRIKKLWLQPPVQINPRAKQAILWADLIIIGPGDLYTSILPNILVGGMREALKKTSAKKVFMVNVMTKFGETSGFKASDFVSEAEKYLGKGVLNYALVGVDRPAPARLKPYLKEKSQWVVLDKAKFNNKPKLIIADLVRPRGFIRHDSDKVARAVMKLL
ncbi:MAG: gluconeogenesis factor YvcK family protein [Candidatus Liptonbacteria bacterium]